MQHIIEHVYVPALTHTDSGDNAISREEIAPILEAYTHNVQVSLPDGVRFEARADYAGQSNRDAFQALDALGVDRSVREACWERAL